MKCPIIILDLRKWKMKIGDKVFAKQEIIQEADSECGHPSFLLARENEELLVIGIDEIKSLWPILVSNTLNEVFWISELEIKYDKD